MSNGVGYSGAGALQTLGLSGSISKVSGEFASGAGAAAGAAGGGLMGALGPISAGLGLVTSVFSGIKAHNDRIKQRNKEELAAKRANMVATRKEDAKARSVLPRFQAMPFGSNNKTFTA